MVLSIFKGIFKTGLYFVTILVGVVYLLTCLIPYINTGNHWAISFLGLGFIPIFFSLVLIAVIWGVLSSKMWIVCLVILFCGFQQVRTAFGFHFTSGFHLEKDNGALRVMQWNVHNWNQLFLEGDSSRFERDQPQMMELVKKYQPDILCSEEFFESTDSTKFKSNIGILRRMGYAYHYFQYSGSPRSHDRTGIAIFSKFPIVQTGNYSEGDKWYSDPMLFADISINQKIVRVFALHLQSVRFMESDYSNIHKMKNDIDSRMKGSRSIASKLKRGYSKRYEQSAEIKDFINQSPYPVIVCGDFNDVPNSGTYFNIRKNLQDAFLKKSSFIGRSFRFISPTLRIDYIMPSKNFDVRQFKTIKAAYSDHYPLVTDLSF